MIDDEKRRWDAGFLRELPATMLCAVMVMASAAMLADHRPVFLVPIVAVAAVGLLVERCRLDSRIWVVLTVLMVVSLFDGWQPKDNHEFLYVYLCGLLLCVARIGEVYTKADRDAVLAVGSRWMLGVLMVAAVIWKCSTPDFLSGEMYQWMLLINSLPVDVAGFLGLVDPAVIADNQQAGRFLAHGYLSDSPEESVLLEGPERLRYLAVVMAWWTIGVEAAVGILFLWPRGSGKSKRYLFHARRVMLIFFMVTTYLVAPVVGFGWALAALGLGSCAQRPTWYRPIFLGLAVVFLPVLAVVPNPGLIW